MASSSGEDDRSVGDLLQLWIEGRIDDTIWDRSELRDLVDQVVDQVLDPPPLPLPTWITSRQRLGDSAIGYTIWSKDNGRLDPPRSARGEPRPLDWVQEVIRAGVEGAILCDKLRALIDWYDARHRCLPIPVAEADRIIAALHQDPMLGRIIQRMLKRYNLRLQRRNVDHLAGKLNPLREEIYEDVLFKFDVQFLQGQIRPKTPWLDRSILGYLQTVAFRHIHRTYKAKRRTIDHESGIALETLHPGQQSASQINQWCGNRRLASMLGLKIERDTRDRDQTIQLAYLNYIDYIQLHRPGPIVTHNEIIAAIADRWDRPAEKVGHWVETAYRSLLRTMTGRFEASGVFTAECADVAVYLIEGHDLGTIARKMDLSSGDVAGFRDQIVRAFQGPWPLP